MATKSTMSAKSKRNAVQAATRATLGGFTIIEVVLVLAIAGLIFMMVFIALPQLQRAQRDTQRRQDLGRLTSAITQYQTNNNGKIPDELNRTFIENYISGVNGNPDVDFADPSTGEMYVINSKNVSDGVPSEAGLSYYYTQAQCDGENPKTVSGKRLFAVIMKLEGAGFYCIDNS